MQYFVQVNKGKPSKNKNKIETLDIVWTWGRICCPTQILLGGLWASKLALRVQIVWGWCSKFLFYFNFEGFPNSIFVISFVSPKSIIGFGDTCDQNYLYFCHKCELCAKTLKLRVSTRLLTKIFLIGLISRHSATLGSFFVEFVHTSAQLLFLCISCWNYKSF